MDFFLFLVVNATLFIRPAEIVPELIGLPIYNVLILTNLLVALPKIIRRSSIETLRAEPITVCVLGLLVLIPLSHLSHLRFGMAWDGVIEFSKVVLYYMILVAVLDTPTRLRRFLAALVIFVLILTALAVLHYHGVINIPSLEAVTDPEVDPVTGEVYLVLRLCSTGIYHDPNDLSLILVVGFWASLFMVGGRSASFIRCTWLVSAGLFVYGLSLTHSKGGFLALLVATLSLLHARFGLRKATPLAVVILPTMLILFAGRQTNISADDTAQDRIQIWAEGFALFRESPLLGIGQNLYGDRVGLVAHNSYVHALAELGFLGGGLFFGAFACGALALLALGRHADSIDDGELRRLRPYLLAMLMGYTFGMMTISRNYVVPTYMMLGVVSAYLRLIAADSPRLIGNDGPVPVLGRRLVGRLVLLEVVLLIAVNVLVKLLIRSS